MRPLFLAAAVLFSTALAQGVTQAEPTTEDLARILGDVTVLEVELPADARTVRIAYTIGVEGEYVEDRTRLKLNGETATRTLRLLLLAPGRTPSPVCEGEPIDVQVHFRDESSSATGFCVPIPEGNARSKHELVLTGPTPALDAWTPVYLRAWTAFEMGAPGSRPGLDPARAFTIQIWPSTQDIEEVDTDPPLDATGLLQVPEILDSANGRGPTRP